MYRGVGGERRHIAGRVVRFHRCCTQSEEYTGNILNMSESGPSTQQSYECTPEDSFKVFSSVWSQSVHFIASHNLELVT